MGTTVTHAPAMEGLTKDSEPRHGPVKPVRPAALKRRRRRENLAGYLFMSPWIAGFLLLTAGPMIASLYFAFTDYNLFDSPKWIGLDNFSEMFGDPRWRHSVQVTMWYVVVGTPLKLLAALGVALLLAQKRRGQAFYRAAFYAPSLIGASVSVAIVWKAIFSDDAIVDRTQKIFGIDAGGWTGDPELIIYSLVALTVWQFGAPMVIF
ncbi:carbohydrate ABC transporter permease, partial [Streptomyces sp. NPDC002814]